MEVFNKGYDLKKRVKLDREVWEHDTAIKSQFFNSKYLDMIVKLPQVVDHYRGY